MKKLTALVLATIMALVLCSTALAGTITITPPTGVDSTAVNTYNVYKVFDAVYSDAGISYKLVSGKTTAPAGFSVDAAGNVTYTGTATDGKLTEADISAIKNYVTSADKVATVQATGTTPVTTEELGTGYFFIDTTTGTVVTIDSTTPNAAVNDKNTVPTLDKKITGATSIDEDGKKALAQVGTDVTYTATITVGKGAKGYVFHDTMEAGLTYKGDVHIQIGETVVPQTTDAGVTNWTPGTADNETFTVDFADDYIKTLAEGTQIKVIYSATVNNNAITTDPLNNTAYVHYGDRSSDNRTPNSEADVYEAKFTVTKNQPAKADDADAVAIDGKYYKPLSGAGFVIKNSAGKYYQLTTTTTGEEPNTVTTNVVSWVDSINDATEYTSGATGAVHSFTGLANGTYTLVEKTVPAGFNKAADITFTIAEHDYAATNLEQQATVTNNAGQELPSTGGIGTTIFYAVGGLMVLGAAIILVSRRKAEAR